MTYGDRVVCCKSNKVEGNDNLINEDVLGGHVLNQGICYAMANIPSVTFLVGHELTF